MEALDRLRAGAGSQFDAAIVELLIDLVAERRAAGADDASALAIAA